MKKLFSNTAEIIPPIYKHGAMCFLLKSLTRLVQVLDTRGMVGPKIGGSARRGSQEPWLEEDGMQPNQEKLV